MDLSTCLTPLPWNGLVPYYIYRASKGTNPSLQMEELQEAYVKSTARMYSCEVCDKSFSRKDNLSCHLLIHSEKKFQCHHCSKCYSRQDKLKVHQTRYHGGERQTTLQCAYCLKYFTRDYTMKRHAKMCLKKIPRSNKTWSGKHNVPTDIFWKTISPEVRSGKDSVNIIELQYGLVRGVFDSRIQESFETISTITSSACASVWESYAKTMAKEGNDIHSTTYPSRGYLGQWSTGRGRQVLPSTLHQVSLQWSTCDYYWHCHRYKRHCPLLVKISAGV